MHKILCVDDEADLLGLCKIYLERAGDLAVETATSARGALGLMERGSFDAIVSDYVMPEMDGISFLRMVRTRHRDLPFILLTGRGREEVAVQAFESGADYYVQKGGDPRAQFTELSQKIRRAIRSREAEQRLRENEARYRTLFDQAAAPTLIIDEDMTIAGANEAMAELTGYSREEMDGKLKWPELILPGDRERLIGYHRWRREDPRSAPTQFEAKYIRRTGEVRTALMKVGLIPGTRQSIASLIDLTEQKEAAARLRESESLFRTLVQASPAFFGTIGADGKTRMMNEAMLRALGYTAEEVEGTDYLTTFVPEEDRDALREVFDRLRLGLPTRNQNHIVTKDGRTILCEWQGRPVFRGADLDYFFGVGMDITEQKQAQDRLRESEEQLRLLVDQSPMGMAVYSPDGTLRQTNRAWDQLWGIPEGQGIGTFNILTNPLTATSPHAAAFRRISRGETIDLPPWEFSPRSAKLPGETRLVAGRGYPLFGADRSVHYVVNVLEDVGEQARATLALRRKTEELDLYFRHALDLLCITDARGRFRRLSVEWERTLGFRLDELEGRSYFELVHPDDLSATRAAAEELARGKPVINFVNRYRGRDGSYRWIEWRSFPYGGMTYAVARDVTERRQIEDALALANRKLTLLTQLTRHDIRNRLMTVSGYLHLIRHTSDRQRVPEHLKKIEESVAWVETQLGFAQDYESLGSRAPFWQSARESFLRACEGRDLRGVEVKTEPINYEVLADAMLEKVFYSLTDNALTHGSGATQLALSGRESSEGLIIALQDNGRGVPAPDKERIFELGFGRQTGWGLFLAREILSLTGISIRETGVPGQGARFELVVPQTAYRSSRSG